MWASLKPTSDLQRVCHFDDYDLAANRMGLFSTRQRRNLFIRSLVNHVFGLLTTAMGLAVIVHSLMLAPDLAMIADVFIVLVVLAILSFVISARPLFLKDVEAVTGLLRKDTSIALDSLLLELVVIGPLCFYVPIPLFETLDEYAIYKAHYLKRAERIGGNLLLSLELIEAAPEDEE